MHHLGTDHKKVIEVGLCAQALKMMERRLFDLYIDAQKNLAEDIVETLPHTSILIEVALVKYGRHIAMTVGCKAFLKDLVKTKMPDAQKKHFLFRRGGADDLHIKTL